MKSGKDDANHRFKSDPIINGSKKLYVYLFIISNGVVVVVCQDQVRRQVSQDPVIEVAELTNRSSTVGTYVAWFAEHPMLVVLQ